MDSSQVLIEANSISFEYSTFFSNNMFSLASYPLWKFNLDAGFEETNNNYFIGNSALTMDRTNLELNGSLGIENRKVGNVDVQLQVSADFFVHAMKIIFIDFQKYHIFRVN